MNPPLKQKFLHDPENGSWGDCWRTAVAFVLGLHRDEVPHFLDQGVDMSEATKHYQTFLHDLGFGTFDVPIIAYSVSQLEDFLEIRAPSSFVVVTGKAARGYDHCVVYQGNKMVFDPHPSDSGLIGPSLVDGEEYFWCEVITATPFTIRKEK